MNSWMGMNGLAGSMAGETNQRGIARRFTSNGGDPATRWNSALSSIPAWRRRMQNVTILSNDGLEICERIEDKDGTVIYADPPYFEKTEAYKHDFTMDDHKRLAAALNEFKQTRVVVSYYEHEAIADLYPGWTKVNCAIEKKLGKNSKGWVEAPEVMLINGRSMAEQGSLFGDEETPMGVRWQSKEACSETRRRHDRTNNR